jgi:phosphate transport system substrate-binding protein
MKSLRLCVALGAVALLGASLPAVASAKKRPTITMSGSTSVAPLASKLAKKYARLYPKRVRFKLGQGGSDIGVADVAAGRVSIGNSSRDPKDTDPGGLVFTKISRDALCLITNKANHLTNLSQGEVQAIYSGNVRDWGSVPGATASGTISLVGRNLASGTQDAFQKLFMGSTKVSNTMAGKASNGLVQQAVRSDPSAIGYVSLAFGAGVNVLSYQGVACTLRNAQTGQYPGTRNFWMVTRGAPKGAVKTWLSWIRHSKAARKIIESEWVTA